MKLQDALGIASVEAIQVAGAWLAEVMRQLVSIQTGLYGPGSSPGEAPRRRTGYGQSGIKMEPTATGCRVGVPAMSSVPGSEKQPNLSGMPGHNYMAGHDAGIGVRGGVERPWLSLWRRYEKEMAHIIQREMKMQTGAT